MARRFTLRSQLLSGDAMAVTAPLSTDIDIEIDLTAAPVEPAVTPAVGENPVIHHDVEARFDIIMAFVVLGLVNLAAVATTAYFLAINAG
ncbi:MAG: hypothetical protein ACR2P0_07835 [Acidimicrobiales bacterium]